MPRHAALLVAWLAGAHAECGGFLSLTAAVNRQRRLRGWLRPAGACGASTTAVSNAITNRRRRGGSSSGGGGGGGGGGIEAELNGAPARDEGCPAAGAGGASSLAVSNAFTSRRWPRGGSSSGGGGGGGSIEAELNGNPERSNWLSPRGEAALSAFEAELGMCCGVCDTATIPSKPQRPMLHRPDALNPPRLPSRPANQLPSRRNWRTRREPRLRNTNRPNTTSKTLRPRREGVTTRARTRAG